MSTLKPGKDFNKSDSPKKLIYDYAVFNGSDSATIKQTISEDTIGTLNGCIFTIDFENALCRDAYNGRTALDDAVTAGRLKRTGSYYKTLSSGLSKLAKASGTLAVHKVCKNEAQNQRNRNKTAARAGVRYVNSNMDNYGKDVDCIITDNQGAHRVLDAVYLADGNTNSEYVLYEKTPLLEEQRWLKSLGFKTGGTTQLWYRDNTNFNVIEHFTESAIQFSKGIKFLRNKKGTTLIKESKQVNTDTLTIA